MSKTKVFPIEPLGDRVVIQRDDTPEESDGGIVMPQQFVKRDLRNRGRVVAVGHGVSHQGSSLKVGVTVSFAEYAATIEEVNGVEYLLVSEQDIFCILRGV